jgi:hypothetical protein
MKEMKGMKERETVTVGTPTKYEEKTARIKYDPTGVLAAIAEVMLARGLNKDAVVAWLNDHEQEAWDTYVGPMLDQIEVEIRESYSEVASFLLVVVSALLASVVLVLVLFLLLFWLQCPRMCL